MKKRLNRRRFRKDQRSLGPLCNSVIHTKYPSIRKFQRNKHDSQDYAQKEYPSFGGRILNKQGSCDENSRSFAIKNFRPPFLAEPLLHHPLHNAPDDPGSRDSTKSTAGLEELRSLPNTCHKDLVTNHSRVHPLSRTRWALERYQGLARLHVLLQPQPGRE